MLEQEPGKPINFSTESLFQQAIAGLLSRMPNVTGVQILQGAQEYGKDIIFYVPGGLSDRLLCGCVVKNTKITGQVSRSSGARTVLLQAQQALDTPHVTGTGQDEYLQRVYVITPHPVAPAAISSIQGALKEKRGQIAFIGGSALFDLFRIHWPDFVADEADAISRYLTDSKDKFEQSHPIAQVAAMYQLGNIEKSSAWIHVPQSFHCTLATYIPGDGVEQLIPNNFNWKKAGLINATTNLRRLDGVLKTVAEWGFLSPLESQSFHEKVKSLSEEMAVGWNEEITKKYRITVGAVGKLAPDADVNLNDRPGLRESITRLKFAADMALTSGIDQTSRTVAELINANPRPEALLADTRLSRLCALADLAAILPPGFLEVADSKIWQVDLELLEKSQSVLVVGSAGYGKTSLCRWSFLTDAERLRCGQSDVVPVYVALHKLAKRPLHTFGDIFMTWLGQSGLIDGVTNLDTARLRIYLDGLDELADEETRKTIALLAKQGAETRKDIQIIVTARNYVQGPWLTWLPRLSLSGFTNSQIQRLISEWFGGKDEEIAHFMSQLNSTPALLDLMRVPLLATLIILVFKQTRRLPESRSRVYDVFIDLMCEGWNLAKGLLRPSRFGLRVKKAVISKIAVNAHRTKSRSFDSQDILQAIEECISKNVYGDGVELREELFHDGLISRSGTYCEFAHLSFQEFLAARELLGEPGHTLLRRAVNDYLCGDDWWFETLRFYIGLSATPRQTYDWIVKQAMKVVKGNGDHYVEDPRDRAEALLQSVRQIFPEAPMAF
jgi:hypothetical protein